MHRSLNPVRIATCILAFAAVTMSATACGTTPVSSPPTSEPSAQSPVSRDDFADQVDIYEAIIRRVCTEDDTFGGTLPKPVVYLVGATNNKAGDLNSEVTGTSKIPVKVRGELTSRLSDMGSEIRWIESPDEAEEDPKTGVARDGGVIIEVGDIVFDGEDSASAQASIYYAPLAAGGTTYLLERSQTGWSITGTNGIMWISCVTGLTTTST